MPSVNDDTVAASSSIRVEYKFIFDGVEAKFDNASGGSHRDPFFIYPDPSLEKFSESSPTGESRRVKYLNENSDYLIVKGLNLDSALIQDDVKVYVGTESCNVSTWNKVMTCKPPPIQPKATTGQNGPPEVVVVIGEGYLNFSLGESDDGSISVVGHFCPVFYLFPSIFSSSFFYPFFVQLLSFSIHFLIKVFIIFVTFYRFPSSFYYFSSSFFIKLNFFCRIFELRRSRPRRRPRRNDYRHRRCVERFSYRRYYFIVRLSS